MKLRDLLLFGAAATSLVLSSAVLADESAPLPAGGPAAQSEGPALGSTVTIGGLIFIVTVGGLVLLDDEDGAIPPAASTSST